MVTGLSHWRGRDLKAVYGKVSSCGRKSESPTLLKLFSVAICFTILNDVLVTFGLIGLRLPLQTLGYSYVRSSKGSRIRVLLQEFARYDAYSVVETGELCNLCCSSVYAKPAKRLALAVPQQSSAVFSPTHPPSENHYSTSSPISSASI